MWLDLLDYFGGESERKNCRVISRFFARATRRMEFTEMKED